MSVWTAQVVRLTPTGNGVEASVVLANDAGLKFQQSYQTDGTVQSLAPQVIATTVRKDAPVQQSDLALGLLDLTPPAAPTPPDPLVVQFQSDLNALRRAERAIADGLTTGNNVTALRAAVQADLDKTPSLAVLL